MFTKLQDCHCEVCRKHFQEWDGDFLDGKFICFECLDLSDDEEYADHSQAH